MYLIAGLGNPTLQYENTRHNAGFGVIDILSKKYNIPLTEKKHKGLLGRGVIEGIKVILCKPQTYMNLSGECIGEIVDYYDLDPESELLVISDDIELDPGRIRIRKKGSAGGHNGLKNIIFMTATDNFPRIKIGVGKKPAEYDLADWVLSHFPEEDKKAVESAGEDAAEAVALILAGNIDEAMNRFNGKK
ncbi:MAG: aminoacyl-tRNA hydrolase [Lachnospiraceae bacterium]|nr:aminoacyl-tRNA hydrolase [Lachnospiraceae bacterium]